MSLLLLGLFSSPCKQGLLSSCSAQVSHCCDFSCHGTWDLGHVASVVAALGLWSTDSIVVAYQLSSSVDMWDLPRSGIESTSPGLAGRFLFTEPPGKPQH